MKLLKAILLAAFVIVTYPHLSFAIPQEGQPAIDFNLPDINDSARLYSLRDFRGKVILLNIWASWCTGCQAEMPEFLNTADEYKGKNFQIVAVSVDNSKEKAINYLKALEEKSHKKVNFTVLYDKDKSITKDYKPRGMPASYLIDKNGKLAKVFLGSFTKDNIETLRSAIRDALK